LLEASAPCTADQGCQMVYFQTKNLNLGKFWRVFQWKVLVYVMAIWYILWSIGIFFTVFVCCTKKIWQPCRYLRRSKVHLPHYRREHLWLRAITEKYLARKENWTFIPALPTKE
jgi:hypothetical protein